MRLGVIVSAAVLLSKKRTSPPSLIKRTYLMNLSPTPHFRLDFASFVILSFTKTVRDLTLFLFGKYNRNSRFARISYPKD